MGFVMPHVTILAGMGVTGLALILQIVGLATPGWIVIDETVGRFSVDVSSGLWKTCSRGTCVEYPTSTASLDACRAFGILGVLAIAACLLMALLICFMSEQKIFTLAAPAAAAAAALCVMIEFAVFAGENSGSSDHFGYSFALTVVAFCLCVIAAIVFFIGRSRSSA